MKKKNRKRLVNNPKDDPEDFSDMFLTEEEREGSEFLRGWDALPEDPLLRKGCEVPTVKPPTQSGSTSQG